VSEKLEAFRAALEALCIEHGVRLSMGYGDDYDHVLRAKESHGGLPAGLDLEAYELEYKPKPTPEEIELLRVEEEARKERKAAEEAKQRAIYKLWFGEGFDREPQHKDWADAAAAHARKTRKQDMRVSTDPADPAYIDARPRKAWCNDVLIEGWTVADEFRRVVITPEKVHHGSVLVERLPALLFTPPQAIENGAELTAEVLGAVSWAEAPNRQSPPAPPIDAGFSGMFVSVPDAKPAAVPAVPAVPLPALQKPAKRRR
jgi:hypothetical protein